MYRDTLLAVGALFLLVVHPSQSFIESVCDGIKMNDEVCQRHEKGNKGNDILIKAKEDGGKNNIGLKETRVILSRYHLGTENSRIYRERSSEDSSATRESSRRQRLSPVSSRFIPFNKDSSSERESRFVQERRVDESTRRLAARENKRTIGAEPQVGRVREEASRIISRRMVAENRRENRDTVSRVLDRNANSRLTSRNDFANFSPSAERRDARRNVETRVDRVREESSRVGSKLTAAERRQESRDTSSRVRDQNTNSRLADRREFSDDIRNADRRVAQREDTSRIVSRRNDAERRQENRDASSRVRVQSTNSRLAARREFTDTSRSVGRRDAQRNTENRIINTESRVDRVREDSSPVDSRRVVAERRLENRESISRVRDQSSDSRLTSRRDDTANRRAVDRRVAQRNAEDRVFGMDSLVSRMRQDSSRVDSRVERRHENRDTVSKERDQTAYSRENARRDVADDRRADRRVSQRNVENLSSFINQLNGGHVRLDRSLSRRETREISQKNRRNGNRDERNNSADRRMVLTRRNDERDVLERETYNLFENARVRSYANERRAADESAANRRLSATSREREFIRVKRETSYDRANSNRLAERRAVRIEDARASATRREARSFGINRFSPEQRIRSSRMESESQTTVSRIARNIPIDVEVSSRREERTSINYRRNNMRHGPDAERSSERRIVRDNVVREDEGRSSRRNVERRNSQREEREMIDQRSTRSAIRRENRIMSLDRQVRTGDRLVSRRNDRSAVAESITRMDRSQNRNSEGESNLQVRANEMTRQSNRVLRSADDDATSRFDNRNMRTRSIERVSRLNGNRRISRERIDERQTERVERIADDRLMSRNNRHIRSLTIENISRLGQRRQTENNERLSRARATPRLAARNLRSQTIDRVSRFDRSSERRNENREVNSRRQSDRIERFTVDREMSRNDNGNIRSSERAINRERSSDSKINTIRQEINSVREFSEKKIAETPSTVRYQRMTSTPEQYEKRSFKLNTLEEITTPTLAELAVQLLKAFCICTIMLQIASTYKDSKMKSGFFRTIQNWGQLIKIKVD